MQTIEMNQTVREKNIAAFLALFLGFAGVHKFYLGKVGQGVLYAIFSWSFLPMILGFIDFLVLMLMDQKTFDEKYNEVVPFRTPPASYIPKHQRHKGGKVILRREEDSSKKVYVPSKKGNVRVNVAKQKLNLAQNKEYLTALDLFNNYRYKEAKLKFEEILRDYPDNAEVYFRLASCNSLLEEKAELFSNMKEAFNNGFKSLERIKTSDSLAFFRIQKEYDELLESGFKIWPTITDDEEEGISVVEVTESKSDTHIEREELSTDELLVQLKKLGELRQSGVLTEEEFLKEKQKLFA